MSENVSSPAPRKPDRRVTRTRDRLGDALLELLLAKPFDAITVEEVLTRSGVSRSTFYTHFRDKNDLFISDVDDFFGAMSTLLTRHGDPSDRVAAVTELFFHVGEARHYYTVMVQSGRMQEMTELGTAHFSRGIEERLSRGPRAGVIPKEQRPALAAALAGALFSLLFWWIRQGAAVAPKAMDELFHSLIPGNPRLR